MLALIVGLVMVCALMWYAAVYALPVFAGFSAGWWAINHGAGFGAIFVGLFVGVVVFELGRLAVTSRNPLWQWIGLATFVIPAFYASFNIVSDLTGQLPMVWRFLFALIGACAAGVAMYQRLTLAD